MHELKDIKCTMTSGSCLNKKTGKYYAETHVEDIEGNKDIYEALQEYDTKEEAEKASIIHHKQLEQYFKKIGVNFAPMNAIPD